jgi:solute carrier family 25 carnitine/acylcarnitine transporter 20/29
VGSFMAGGLSGLVAWVFIYPQDCIKSLMQSSEKKGFVNCLMHLYQQGGVRRFYKGFHYAVMRAVPLHAGTFFCFNWLTSR